MLLHVILYKLLILTSYLNEHSKYEYVQNSAVITKDSIDGTLYNFKLRFTPEDGYAWKDGTTIAKEVTLYGVNPGTLQEDAKLPIKEGTTYYFRNTITYDESSKSFGRLIENKTITTDTQLNKELINWFKNKTSKDVASQYIVNNMLEGLLIKNCELSYVQGSAKIITESSNDPAYNKAYSLQIKFVPQDGHAWEDGTTTPKYMTVYGVK